MIAMSILLIMVNGLTVAAEMSKESVTISDYINSPSKIVKGNYYDKNVKWFKNQATQRIQNGIILDDVPW